MGIKKQAPYEEEIFDDLQEIVDLIPSCARQYVLGGAPECVIDQIEIITNRIRKNIEAEREWLKQ